MVGREELIGTTEYLTVQTRCHIKLCHYSGVRLHTVAYPGILLGGVGGGVQQIQLRTENRQNGDLGAVTTPSQ